MQKIGVILNGVTGRMGTNQHLMRSILAIREQGGVPVDGDERVMPDPILVGRNRAKLDALAARFDLERVSTDLDDALADPYNRVYFDAQITRLRAPAVRAAMAAGKAIYCEKPTAETLHEALALYHEARAAGVELGDGDKISPADLAVRVWLERPDILERYRGKGDLPFNPTGEGRDTCDRYVQEFFGNPGELPDDVIRSAREVYFSLVTEFDEYAGKILDCLEESGLADDTVVLYFSDHGEMAGEHGLWAKVTLLETSSRVPLVIRWPGHIQPGMRIDTPVSLVDLFPTFLELGGVALPETLFTDGYSLLPLLGGEPEKFEGDGVFCEFEGEGWNHPRAFLRVGKYKYVYNHTAESPLYDLEADPNEMHDLSGKPEYAEVEAKLKARLLADWDPDDIERRVIRAQARRKIARNKNVCKDIGW